MNKKTEKEETKSDTTRWWLVSPYNISKSPCVNDKGEYVDLNSAQANDDYRFYKELHLTSDTTERTVGGALRYKPGAPVPMLRDCVVYGHNVRNGHFKHYTSSETEAMNIVRVHMTKWLKLGDTIPGK